MRVLIKTEGSFRLKDETVLKCIEAGLEEFFFEWGEYRREQKYGVDQRRFKELRCNRTFIDIIIGLGEDAFTEESGCRVSVIDIPFDSLDGWHVVESQCSNSEFISENHRCWWESDTGGTEEHMSIA